MFGGGVLAASQATLSWKANTEPDIAGYKIYYGVFPRTDSCPPGGYPNKIDTGKTNTRNSPSYTIGNLEEGKTYYFSLTSYDISGNESCFSKEINKTMPAAKISLFGYVNRLFNDMFGSITLIFQKIFHKQF